MEERIIVGIGCLLIILFVFLHPVKEEMQEGKFIRLRMRGISSLLILIIPIALFAGASYYLIEGLNTQALAFLILALLSVPVFKPWRAGYRLRIDLEKEDMVREAWFLKTETVSALTPIKRCWDSELKIGTLKVPWNFASTLTPLLSKLKASG